MNLSCPLYMYPDANTLILLEKLNLYNLDGGIEKTLQEVQEQVESSDPNDNDQCDDVLKKFITACDPNSESCSNANQHTYQGRVLYLSSTLTSFSYDLYLTHFHFQHKSYHRSSL